MTTPFVLTPFVLRITGLQFVSLVLRLLTYQLLGSINAVSSFDIPCCTFPFVFHSHAPVLVFVSGQD